MQLANMLVHGLGLQMLGQAPGLKIFLGGFMCCFYTDTIINHVFMSVTYSCQEGLGTLNANALVIFTNLDGVCA